MEPESEARLELRTFIVQLGAAMNASGQPVDVVESRLRAVARATGAEEVRVSAFPTYLLVAMGRGEPATLELTTPLGRSPRLDQIASIDRLSIEAMHAGVTPAEGLLRLDEISRLPERFPTPVAVAGYGLLSLGVCLIVRPAPPDVLAAAFFGALVGVLRTLGRRQPATQVLMPVVASFVVAGLSALAVKSELDGPGLAAIVASLVVFLPGASLTSAVLELGSGQMVAGASRLVSGVVELALLAFGILAGIQAVGVPAPRVFSGSDELLGSWAPWLGVAVFAVGVTLARSAPRRSLPGLLFVLYVAWSGQLLGNALFGGYMSALVGATVLTLAAFFVARFGSSMPPHASFLPGFWLLVPGALGLIGLTRYAGGGAGSSDDLLQTIGSIFGVALGVLCGTQLWAWGIATGRVMSEVSVVIPAPRKLFTRRRSAERKPRRDAAGPPGPMSH